MTTTDTIPRTLRINVDGSTERFDSPVLDVARRAFDGMTSVVTLAALAVERDGTVRPLTEGEVVGLNDVEDIDYLVGVVHDMGVLEGMPVNPYAWVLYGRSPIVGPMFIARDSGQPLPDTLVAMIEAKDQVNEETLNVMTALVAIKYPDYVWSQS